MTEVTPDKLPYTELPVSDSIALRQLHPDDAGKLFTLVDSNRTHLSAWLPWVEDSTSAQDTREFIESTLHKRQTGAAYEYGIFLDGQLVGHASLMHVNDGSELEIGYWIAEQTSGRGVTTAAAKALTDFGFGELGLDKIVIKAEPANVASNKIAEKLGYTLERTERSKRVDRQVNVWSATPTQK